jgi:hypothetical protein
MRQLSSELLILPPLRCGENQEFETDALRALLNCRIVEDASRLDNAADEENPLIVRRKAPHNQRIEQTPFGRSSSAALCVRKEIKLWHLHNK